ncbi:MAG: response regulator [Chloroflexi bacterium]|nr:response regulator [Chloroflexota bacterium]
MMELAAVLVVEDDPTLREVVGELLAEEGYAVQQAANGLEALDCLLEQRPAVIVLDLMMPVMDGWEFLRQARERGLLGSSRVVALTATRMTRDSERSLGVDALVPKPFDIPALLSTLARLRVVSGQ